MSRFASERHRRMDMAAAETMARDGGEPGGAGHVLVVPRARMRDLRSMNGNRVPLATVSVRVSKGGRPYWVGFLGRSKLLGFPGAETDRFGNETVELFLVEHEPRPAGTDRPGASPSAENGSGGVQHPPEPRARPGVSEPPGSTDWP